MIPRTRRGENHRAAIDGRSNARTERASPTTHSTSIKACRPEQPGNRRDVPVESWTTPRLTSVVSTAPARQLPRSSNGRARGAAARVD